MDNKQLNFEFIAAAEEGNLTKIKSLLKQGADINATADDKCTALHVAAIEDYYDCLQYLATHGCNIDAQDHEGKTAAHKATIVGNLKCLKYLVAHSANLNLRDMQGRTPLYCAAQIGRISHAKYLLEHNANPLISANNGKTPLDYVNSEDDDPDMKSLLESFLFTKSEFNALSTAISINNTRLSLQF